jgi:dynein heavy chain 2
MLNNQSIYISLQTNGKLMELNHKDGKLNVLYGDKLITLLREVRQFQALGFKIPPRVDECAKIGQRFYKHGIILKQVLVSFVFLSSPI